MPDTYKSQGVKLTATTNTTIYSGVVGTALVNSINISNTSADTNVSINVFLVKSGTSYSIISNAIIPFGTTMQALDTPIVCESGNTITATAGTANMLECVTSVLEIT